MGGREPSLEALAANNGLPIVKLLDHIFVLLLLLHKSIKIDFLFPRVKPIVGKHLVQLLGTIVVHKLVYTHVPSSNSDDQLPISDLCIDLLFPKFIIAVTYPLDGNWAAVLKDPVCHHLVNLIPHRWLILRKCLQPKLAPLVT
jgi:hypothetical protein